MFNLRYSREIALKELSVSGYEAISNAHVCIVGLGATGSPVADLFARAGVGNLKLIDGDTVDISNLHRQILFSEKDVGEKKVNAAKSRLNLVNSKCNIESIDSFLTENNVSSLLDNCDIVVDGTDNMEARRVINRHCVRAGTPWIFMSSIGTVAQVKGVIPGKTSCLDCFVDQKANYPMSCEETGVLAASPVIASSTAWTIAVRILTGQSVDGDLLYIDPWSNTHEKIHINRKEDCITCSKL